MPFTMQGSRTQCILHRKPQHCVITLSHDALLIFPLTIPRDTVLRSLVMYNFSILKLQRQEYCRCRQWWVWLLQSKVLHGITRWGKKTTRGLNAAGHFLLMFAQQTSSDLGTLTTDHSTASILTLAQKHTGKKKNPQRNHLTTSPWTMCSYMETVVI